MQYPSGLVYLMYQVVERRAGLRVRDAGSGWGGSWCAGGNTDLTAPSPSPSCEGQMCSQLLPAVSLILYEMLLLKGKIPSWLLSVSN